MTNVIKVNSMTNFEAQLELTPEGKLILTCVELDLRLEGDGDNDEELLKQFITQLRKAEAEGKGHRTMGRIPK